MKKVRETLVKGKRLFIGIDLHKRTWVVTVRTREGELLTVTMAASWEALSGFLSRYAGNHLVVGYEAGYFGFWLYDRLAEAGYEAVLIPPSLIPEARGNRVKTDKKDSKKLAKYLADAGSPRVWVPAKELRAERQVSRRRRQLVEDRVRVQLRIKAELARVNVTIAARGKWSLLARERLSQLKAFGTRWEQESFQRLLAEYDFLCQAVAEQTKLLKALAATERYRHGVAILTSTPGIGLVCAMEILLEIGDVTRFGKARQLAAYLGLTPSQDSSGEHVRLGHITGSGKRVLRGLLVEAAWSLIDKDGAMRAIYERIRQHAGAKRAIVAVARRLVLVLRRLLLEGRPYRLAVPQPA